MNSCSWVIYTNLLDSTINRINNSVTIQQNQGREFIRCLCTLSAQLVAGLRLHMGVKRSTGPQHVVPEGKQPVGAEVVAVVEVMHACGPQH